MSFKPYPKYKDSGVEWLGKVPEGWEVSRLSFLVGLESGKRIPSEGQDHERIYSIGGEHIQNRGFYLENPVFISPDTWDSQFKGRINPEDILLVKDGATTGKLMFVDAMPSSRMMVNEHVFRVMVGRGINSKFCYYAMEDRTFQQQMWQTIMASAQPGINREFAKKTLIAVPAPDEQSSISSFLDHETSKIDSLIKEQEKLIELLKEKRAAVISHAVTKGLNVNVKMKDSGVEWLGKVPEHWEVIKLGRIATTKGGAGFPDEHQGQTEEELPFFKVGDISGSDTDGVMRRPNHTISRETAQILRATVFESGTIVFAKVGAALLLQRYRRLGQPSCIDNNMMGMSAGKSVIPDFLLSVLPLLDLKTIVNPGAVPSVNESQISSQKVPLPPLIEQQEIAEKLKHLNAKTDALIEEAESAINLLQERRSALISAAVTGQIDVRDFVPSKAA